MKFFSTIRNIFAIEELRTRIFNTLLFIVVFRLGTFVLLPGVNPAAVSGEIGGVFGFLDGFVGGAFSNRAIFGLGIMPYISASIVIQLAGVAIPYFQRLQKEGESGRKKMTQITRVLTIVICMIQSYGFIQLILGGDKGASMLLPGVDKTFFTVQSIFILTAGTVFCMWVGERITEKGIGNGISMLIMIGIISRLPNAIIKEFDVHGGMDGAFVYLLEFIALFFIVMGVVMLTQAVRRIPVRYAKQVVNNKVYGGERQYIPLKVNSAGVMPIIFAQSLMFIPGLIAGQFTQGSTTAAWISANFGSYNNLGYIIALAVLIILFTYFYTAITIQPNQIADDLKRNGGFIPGVKPGAPTGEFIDNILSKITLPGALFIALVAILPAFAAKANVGDGLAQFFGGTSLLIMVGVVLDTLQQIESYLLMRHYEGMMKSGKVKGRSQNVAVA